MDVYESVVERENTYYRPFLLTTTIMMEAVKAGVGREEAHKVIKKHAVATVEGLRACVIDQNNLLERLAADEEIPLTLAQLQLLEQSGKENVGLAKEQILHFFERVHEMVAQCPEAMELKPESIL